MFVLSFFLIYKILGSIKPNAWNFYSSLFLSIFKIKDEHKVYTNAGQFQTQDIHTHLRNQPRQREPNS